MTAVVLNAEYDDRTHVRTIHSNASIASDKDSVILRLRVELAQERARRKEETRAERDLRKERMLAEHALERALVDERVHGLELEAEVSRIRRDCDGLKKREDVLTKENKRNMEEMEILAERAERGKSREKKVTNVLREESEELRELLTRSRKETFEASTKASMTDEFAKKLNRARKETEHLRKRLSLCERRLENSLCENIQRRQKELASATALKKALHLSAQLSRQQEEKLRNRNDDEALFNTNENNVHDDVYEEDEGDDDDDEKYEYEQYASSIISEE